MSVRPIGGDRKVSPDRKRELRSDLERAGHAAIDMERNVTGVEVLTGSKGDRPGLALARRQDRAALHTVDVEVVHVVARVLDDERHLAGRNRRLRQLELVVDHVDGDGRLSATDVAGRRGLLRRGGRSATAAAARRRRDADTEEAL